MTEIYLQYIPDIFMHIKIKKKVWNQPIQTALDDWG